MPDINLRSIDLNLLTVFEAVYEEQSQIKASERIGMTQPAISHALSRLRHIMGDRLFIGRSKGLQPTPFAQEFYLRVHQALELIRQELNGRQQFQPETSQRTFVVAMGYGGGGILGVKLYQRIHAEAPMARLVIRSIDPADEIPGLLREHKLDAAFHPDRFDDPMLEQTLALENTFAVIVANNHPRIRKAPSYDELMNEHFVSVYESLIKHEHDGIRNFIESIAVRSTVEVPNALLLPLTVEATDLLAIVPSRIAKSFISAHAISMYPLPLELPTLHSHLIWHKSMENDPANRWLRTLCRELMTELNHSQS